MGEEQGSGRDTRMMLPVYGCLFMIVNLLFLPWFSIPVLKNEGLQRDYSLWKLKNCIENINACAAMEGRWKISPLTESQAFQVVRMIKIVHILAVILVIFLILGAVSAYLKGKKSIIFLKIIYAFSTLFCAFICWIGYRGNCLINANMGRKNTFQNLSLDSFLTVSAWAYGQLFLSVLLFFFVRQMMDTEKEFRPLKGIKRGTVSVLIILIGMPLLIAFGIFFLGDRSSVFIGMCMVILAMLPFFMIFEKRQPQAREILLIAVMAALAVVGRLAFFMLPQFKPVSAIVIITGVSLGAEAGFLTGVTAGFVSNFFFGQGPWTPWQMFAFGIIGFLAGIFFYRKSGKLPGKLVLCIYGGTAVFAVYGALVDFSTVLNYAGNISISSAVPILISGIPFNLIHGVSTVVFLWFLAVPVCRKLSRIKKKYGILEA